MENARIADTAGKPSTSSPGSGDKVDTSRNFLSHDRLSMNVKKESEDDGDPALISSEARVGKGNNGRNSDSHAEKPLTSSRDGGLKVAKSSVSHSKISGARNSDSHDKLSTLTAIKEAQQVADKKVAASPVQKSDKEKYSTVHEDGAAVVTKESISIPSSSSGDEGTDIHAHSSKNERDSPRNITETLFANHDDRSSDLLYKISKRDEKFSKISSGLSSVSSNSTRKDELPSLSPNVTRNNALASSFRAKPTE